MAPLIAISLVALMGAGALAFDYARLVALDTELQNAADHAALAGATQINETAGWQEGECAAVNDAARQLVANETRLANEGEPPIQLLAGFAEVASGTGASGVECEEGDTVRVNVVPRSVNFGLGAVVELDSADGRASARAAIGDGAVCNTPPLMMCSPTGGDFDPDQHVGKGLVVFQGGAAGGWGPGAFGWLNVSQGGQNGTPAQRDMLLLNHNHQQCFNTREAEVDPGVTQTLLNALNVRFDIFNGGGEVAQCRNDADCPIAKNVGKDLVNVASPSSNQACGIATGGGGQGWRAPTNSPITAILANSTDPTSISSIGLPRDTCHYRWRGSGTPCPTVMPRLGDASWARQLYMAKNHGNASIGSVSRIPEIAAKAPAVTRYEVYRWEIANAATTGLTSIDAGGARFNHRAPKCTSQSVDAAPDQADRRVISVAVVNNCSAISGSSTALDINRWMDVFLVEPSVRRRVGGVDYTEDSDIYVEILGRSNIAGTQGNQGQLVMRREPYLVE